MTPKAKPAAKDPKATTVSASELKNGWHSYLELVDSSKQEIVVTRYGRPMAKLVPFEEAEGAKGIVGILAGTVTFHGDIVAPTGEVWEADA